MKATYIKYTDNELLEKASDKFIEKCEKYFELVWFARKPNYEDEPEFYEGKTKEKKEIIRKCMDAMKAVMHKYPEEVQELSSPEVGDWHHGFNSGCLAAFRYAIEVINAYKETDEDGFEYCSYEQSEEDFPDLET